MPKKKIETPLCVTPKDALEVAGFRQRRSYEAHCAEEREREAGLGLDVTNRIKITNRIWGS